MKKNEPIRIAQIMGKWVGGGVEAVVMNYYKHINRSKIQFDFICDSDSTSIPYDEIASLGGKVILIPPYQKIFKYHKELKKVLQEGNYKIVHSHINTLSVFSLFAAKRANVPIRIAHSHSNTSFKEKTRNILKQILRPFSKIFSTDLFCCSESSGRWLFGNKVYDEGKVFLLNNAIELEKFSFNEKIRKKRRKELGIDNNTLVIGHVGRFAKVKNHIFLIDIFNELHKQISDSILLLVGDGQLISEVKEKVKNLGLEKYVKFLGQRNDVNELYQSFDVFVLPSLYEGFPVVGVEAQASGLLCVMSTNITKDINIVNTTIFISLLLSNKDWADKIINCKDYKRESKIKEMENRNFNINIEAKKMEAKYMELFNKIDVH